MPHEERNAWSALIGSAITLLYFGVPIGMASMSGLYAGSDGLSLWAWDVIWFMVGGIAIMIAVLVAFQILYAIVMRTSKPSFVTDERDVMISRRGVQVTLVIASTAFIVAVIMLARGWGAIGALNMILFGMAFGSVSAEIYRIAVYRLGF